MKITNATIAFAQDLFTAKAGEDGGKPKFKASLLLKKGDPQIAAINAAMDACAKTKWPKDHEKIMKGLRATAKVCMGDGDNKDYDGYEGSMFISASNALRVPVYNKDKTPVVESDGIIYSGAVVHAIVEVWAQDNDFGKRINCELQGVQFVRDGERFGGGGRVADESEFDDITEGADADSLV